jgi:hypothetical protein
VAILCFCRLSLDSRNSSHPYQENLPRLSGEGAVTAEQLLGARGPVSTNNGRAPQASGPGTHPYDFMFEAELAAAAAGRGAQSLGGPGGAAEAEAEAAAHAAAKDRLVAGMDLAGGRAQPGAAAAAASVRSVKLAAGAAQPGTARQGVRFVEPPTAQVGQVCFNQGWL